jgi:hypothetical protein
VDVEGPFALVDAVDGAFLDAGLVLDVDARLSDHVGHFEVLPGLQSRRSARQTAYGSYYRLEDEHPNPCAHWMEGLATMADDGSERPPEPSAPPWRSWETGTRVMIRRRLPVGATHLFSDVIGTIVRTDVTGVTLETRSGTVDVPAAEIALGKPVPPAPVRRGAS